MYIEKPKFNKSNELSHYAPASYKMPFPNPIIACIHMYVCMFISVCLLVYLYKYSDLCLSIADTGWRLLGFGFLSIC